MACNGVRLCLTLGIIGAIVIITGGLVGWVAVPKIVRSKIAEIIPLKMDSESWDRWKDIPVPIQFQIYIFNVSNPDGILKGEKPVVEEIGPYVYSEKRIKDIRLVDEEKSKIIYEQKLIFEFDGEASKNRTEDDVLTVVNVVALAFAQTVDNLKSISPVIKLFNTSLNKMWPEADPNPIFLKTRVRDYLFEGCPMLCNQSLTDKNTDTRILCEAFRIVHPKTTLLDVGEKGVNTFAFFQYKNNSYDGVYEIDSGINDVTKLGEIKSWNNRTHVSDWKAETCNRILGTDATIFRPYLEEDTIDELHIYNTDVCRSIKVTYEKETEFKGVTGRRYVTDENVFASVLKNDENYCFCPQSVKGITHYSGCLKSGALELSSCQGAPVVLSHPHFLMADPSYQNQIKGLTPHEDKHKIFLDLEPYTGYPLRAASRVQLNIFLKSIPEVDRMKNLPNVLMPVIWLEEKFELTDDLIDVINSQLLSVLKIVNFVKYGTIVIGVLLLLGSCSYYFIKIRGKNKNLKTGTSVRGRPKPNQPIPPNPKKETPRTPKTPRAPQPSQTPKVILNRK